MARRSAKREHGDCMIHIRVFKWHGMPMNDNDLQVKMGNTFSFQLSTFPENEEKKQVK